jgi:hypothetical protein
MSRSDDIDVRVAHVRPTANGVRVIVPTETRDHCCLGREQVELEAASHENEVTAAGERCATVAIRLG